MEEHKETQLRNGEVVTPLGTFSEAVRKEDYSQLLEIVIAGLIVIGITTLIYLIYLLLK